MASFFQQDDGNDDHDDKAFVSRRNPNCAHLRIKV